MSLESGVLRTCSYITSCSGSVTIDEEGRLSHSKERMAGTWSMGWKGHAGDSPIEPLPPSLSAAVERTAASISAADLQLITAPQAFDEDLHLVDGSPLTAQYLLVVDALNFCFWPGECDTGPRGG
jgi:hypothetical protein